MEGPGVLSCLGGLFPGGVAHPASPAQTAATSASSQPLSAPSPHPVPPSALTTPWHQRHPSEAHYSSGSVAMGATSPFRPDLRSVCVSQDGGSFASRCGRAGAAQRTEPPARPWGNFHPRAGPVSRLLSALAGQDPCQPLSVET